MWALNTFAPSTGEFHAGEEVADKTHEDLKSRIEVTEMERNLSNRINKQ